VGTDHDFLGAYSVGMANRCHHYEAAFEAYLRSRRIPYVAVDEAKKALLPQFGPLRMQAGFEGQATLVARRELRAARVHAAETAAGGWEDDYHAACGQTETGDQPGPGIEPENGVEPENSGRPDALKSFDFVIYGQGGNLLVEIKGRRVLRPSTTARLENWATREDIDSLLRWECLFGDRFEAAIVFVYHYQQQPPDALFEELFTHGGLWYGLRVVMVRDYVRAMRARSPRWGTVDLPRTVFDQISTPFSPRTLDARRDARGQLCEYGDRVPALMPF